MAESEHLTIDAIEDGVATLEDADGRTREVRADTLPHGAREGDTLLTDPDQPDGPFTLAPRDDAVLDAARATREALPKSPDGDIDL